MRGDAKRIRDFRQRLREPVTLDEHNSVIAAQGGKKCVDLRCQFVCGELLVQREDGSVEAVYAGEVSVRGIYGYV